MRASSLTPPRLAKSYAAQIGGAERNPDHRASLLRRLAAALLIVAAGLIAYGNSTAGVFLLDDDKHILNNPRVRLVWPLSETMAGRRPMVDLSLALNYHFGKLDPPGYHRVNLAVHIFAALTLWGVVRRTFFRNICGETVRQSATTLALMCSLLWVVHPLQTQSVTYLIQRGESLMGLFYLLTLYCTIRGAESVGDRSWYSAAWYAAAVACCALGRGSKAVMVTAPIVVLLYDRIFLSPSFREVWVRRWALYVGLAATWIVLVVSGEFRGILAWTLPSATVGFSYKGTTPWEYLGTQMGVIVYYIRLAFWPHPLCLDYGWPSAQGAPDVLLPGVVTVGLVVATAWATARRTALGFIGAWFFLILSPTSTVIPIKDPAFEHRMYLPLAALLVLVIVGLGCTRRFLVKLCPSHRRLVGRASVGLVAAVIVAWMFATQRRNRDYHDDLHMWTDVLAKRPYHARGYLGLGEALYKQDRKLEAEDAFSQAARLKPGYADAHYNLGNTLAENGKLQEAVEAYQNCLKWNRTHTSCYYNLGNTLKKLRRVTEAVEAYRKTLELRPSHVSARVNLGNSLMMQGRLEEALAEYNAALRFEPRHVNAHLNRGDALRRLGKFQAAAAEFQSVLALEPGNETAQKALAELRAAGYSPKP